MTSWIIDTTTQVRDFFVPARNGWMLYLAAAMLVMLYIFLILPGHLERLVAFIYSKITGKQAVK
jgi:7-cyano-7-deazaguanine synthase in queuosine biosynthesis